jgi:hypothetical protein
MEQAAVRARLDLFELEDVVSGSARGKHAVICAGDPDLR